MTILFQAKFLVLTCIILIGLSANSNEVLIHTDSSKNELFRINDDSYRLSIKNPQRYGSCGSGYFGNDYQIDDTILQPALDNICHEYNDSSHNTWSYKVERKNNKSASRYNFGMLCNGGANLGVYLSCKKKVDPDELAKKMKQKEAYRLAYRKQQGKKEEGRKQQPADEGRKKQQPITELESKKNIKQTKNNSLANKLDLNILKEACESIGFTPKTEPFGNCVLKLSERKDLTLTKIDTKNQFDLTKFNNYVCSSEHDNTKTVKSVGVVNLTSSYMPLERTSEKDSYESNLISRADNFCETKGAEKMDFAYYQGGKFNFTCKNKNINTNTDLCITKYYAPREFMSYSYQEKNNFSLNELSLIEAPKRKKRSYSKVQTYTPPKPSNNLFEDLLSAGLIIGGAYLLGNALSSPSTAIAPGTTIINRIKPSNKMIYGPYETPFGY